MKTFFIIFLLATSVLGEEVRAGLVQRGDQILAKEKANVRMTPASVQKLLVGAAALHYLGPDYRIVTELRSAKAPQGGVLEDLVVVAAGDPTWSERFFESTMPTERLAASLKEKGVQRVAGDLVVDISRFPGRPHAVSRSGVELAHAFSAPTSGFAVDENAVLVRLIPGPGIGAPARLEAKGKAARIAWTNRVHMVSEERHERGTVDFLPVWGEPRVIVRGEYPISEPSYNLRLSVPDPNAHAGHALAAAIQAAGIPIDGRVRVVRTAPTASLTLVRIESPPLTEILVPIFHKSHNWLAEMLLLQISYAVQGEGRDDEALDLIASFLTENVGVDEKDFVLDDGSGLSPFNLITADAVVRMLKHAQGATWGQAFIAALPNTREGTLRAWSRAGDIRAKTGTLRDSLALAGYAGPRNEIAFAVFRGHLDDQPKASVRSEMTDWLRSSW